MRFDERNNCLDKRLEKEMFSFLIGILGPR